MANSSDSPATITVNLGEEVVTVTVTDLTPTRIRRTRAEISAESARKRVLKDVVRAVKAAARLVNREQRKAEKAERAARAKERRQAALAKRIAADKRRRERRDTSRQTIGLRPETPRHVFVERLQDDPEKAFSNHVVDTTWADEDAFIARLDAGTEEIEVAEKSAELDLRDRIALGVGTMADTIVLLALELEEAIDDVVDWFFGIGDELTFATALELTAVVEAMTPAKRRWGSEKVGGGYCTSDIPNHLRHTIESRRGNGWKVHRRYQNKMVSV